jgi:hypothetical protein
VQIFKAIMVKYIGIWEWGHKIGDIAWLL